MWEYKYYRVRQTGNPFWMDSVTGDLNALGRNGWEVVNFDPVREMILLKRRRQ